MGRLTPHKYTRSNLSIVSFPVPENKKAILCFQKTADTDTYLRFIYVERGVYMW